MDQDDSLVRRRSRRSTAGNRMEAALAELAIEDVNQELEEDKDFIIAKDEEDVFASDFESTDEEAAQAPEIGETAVLDEERREKKTARSRVEKATAAAHARQKVTFNPTAYEETPSSDKSTALEKRKRRVSLGLAINVETGEVINNAKRQSRRTHTVANTTATVSRMKNAEEKRSATPKKVKVKARALNQEELIARALDMEEGNIIEHRNYLSNEEEKRKRAHVVRTSIEGPLLRWISKREDVTVLVDAPLGSGVPDHSHIHWQMSSDDPSHPPSPANLSTPAFNPIGGPAVSVPPSQASSSTYPSATLSAPLTPMSVPPGEPPKIAKRETGAKNYVVHETSQSEIASRPTWKETMAAMFGDEVKWDEVKVYASKGRPLSRPVQTCPITGLPAKYLDPRTNVPYATLGAYDTLTNILNHAYVWSRNLGCYVSNEFEKGPDPEMATREQALSGPANWRSTKPTAAANLLRSRLQTLRTESPFSSALNMSRPWSAYNSTRPSDSRLGTDASRPWTTQSFSTTTARPKTAQSRPGTARPTTAASSRHEGSFVIAVLEGRGVAREVGMAALDRDTGRVMLIQLADCQTYVKTLHQMHLHTPSLVLVPDTFLSAADTSLASGGKKPRSTSLLLQCIQDEFPFVPVEPVLRRYWNEDVGLKFINQLCIEDDERAATLLAASNKYYALSATSALFKYAELKLNTRFAACSLRIRFVPVDGTMMIDPETARNLELVGNMTWKKSPHSLLGVLNHTYTAMAGRALRANILAPITVQISIDARLDVVEELIQSEERFTEIKDALKQMNKMDFDKLISSLAASETRPASTAKAASSRVSQLLNLRNVVKTLPALQKALIGSRSQLLQIICDMISDDRLSKIERLVCDSLNEDASPHKGGIGAVNARVYAVKANRNPLLDVARETYKENVGDIYALQRSLAEKYELPLTLVYQDAGFILAVPQNQIEDSFPKGFIDANLRKGKWTFSTMELKKRNSRMKDALDETLILSDTTIQSLVTEILQDVGALYKASEAIALLDMLWSFAHISILRHYSETFWSSYSIPVLKILATVRPEFTDTLAIKAGRHPILEGKSTYLKQIGLLAIMAMCGCFVPAEYASFRIHRSLLTRLSNDDDMEKNLSTFANEMSSTAMILGLADSNSLVLIDELGRGTSPREGAGISHAIAEALISMKCFVFFATHFQELSITLSRQPSVVKIVDGALENMDHYGIEIARLADLPNDALSEARSVAVRLAGLEAQQREESQSTKVAARRKALLRLRTQLTQALNHSALPDEDFGTYIGRFQKEIIKVLDESL
ncbi:hypothetical protein EW146_g6239 [Bondarzewia mesenterica]|uniref:DNA mismatch repair proteins mutS family domain-containing protein n=1 Tax=Bondarzewia mesenterica TaxID=1095465 RepID=A0A4S4LR23_9AGAM|nr:hypothetical protein EW146_g6239 [Bondarzewia mesenterica]